MTQRAVVWIGVYLLLVAAPLGVLLIGQMPPGREFWWDFSMALGFAGMAMMGVQFALTARFRRASAPFGIDLIYRFHRYLAFVALGLVLSHFAILWLGYSDELGSLDPRVARWELTAARIALVLFALAIITSQWRKQLRIDYGIWRYSHAALATLGFGAATAHIVGVGYYTEAPGKRALWLLVTLFWVLLIVWLRLVKPWQQKLRPFRVVEVRQEANEAWTLAIEPDGHRGLARFRPGQFAWLSVRSSPFLLREHPFSIASAPEQLPRIEFGIKELGDFTGTIKTVTPGERVYLDAAYGVFSSDLHPAPGYGFIAGGIGITPVISMLRSLRERGDQRPLWLFYGSPSENEIIYREDIDALGKQLNLTVVHILTNPSDAWTGETGFVTREILERYLPVGRADLHYFLCGPAPMISAAEEGLRELGVPDDHMQSELFELV